MEKSVSALIETGMSHFNAGRYENATADFSLALRRDAGHADARKFLLHARFEQSRVAFEQGNIDEALDGVDFLLKHQAAAPELIKPVAELHRRLATVLMGSGRVQRNGKLLRHAPSDDPSDLITAVKANLLFGRFDEAFEVSERLLASGRTQENLELLLFPFAGVADAELLKRPKLADKLARYSRERPDSPWPGLVRTSLFHRVDDARSTLRELEGLKKLSSRYGWMRLLSGKLILHLRRTAYVAAEKEFAAALKSAPGLMMAGAYIAELALCRGQTRRAFSILNGLVDRFDGRTGADALAWRGELYLWIGEYSKAIKDLDRAVRNGARFAHGWRGAARAQTGRLPEALNDLNAALAGHPQDQEILTWRGEVLRRLDRNQEALASLGAAIAMPRISPWARANRGLIYLKGGDPRRALSDYAAIPAATRVIFHKAAGVAVTRTPDGDTLQTVFEAGLRLARGVRRTDAYLFPVWSKPTSRRRASRVLGTASSPLRSRRSA